MNLSTYIATRYLSSRSGRSFYSLVTAVSFIGLVLGVVSLLVVVSVMNGFDRELKIRILGAIPHVFIEGVTPETLSIRPASDAGALVTPFQEADVLVVTDRASQLVTVQGVIPDLERSVSNIPGAMIGVEFASILPGSNYVIFGASLARKLNLTPGDYVSLVLPVSSGGGKTISPKLTKVQFIGSFSIGSELDYRLAVMHLEDLSHFLGKSPGVRITLEDIYQAPRLTLMLNENGYIADDWTERYGSFFQTVRMEKVMMFFVLTFVIAIASFSIVAGLSMLVNTKRREIAVLRTMGMKGSAIMRLFFVQGSVITTAGVSVGLIIGLPLAFYAPNVIGIFESAIGFSLVEGTYFDRIPTDPRLSDIAIILIVSTLIGCLATLYPARKAAKLAPAEILRHE